MKLCIDPGHGLSNRRPGVYDSGAMIQTEKAWFEEADIALEWALTLKYFCVEAGLEVFLTRTARDWAAPLSERVAKARAAGCTRLLSLHCNAFDGSARGVETLYREGSERSKAWATDVQATALAELGFLTVPGQEARAPGLPNRGIKPDTQSQHSGGLAILRGGLLGCLLEIGFIDNPEDRAVLLSRGARVAFAEALVKKLLALESGAAGM